MSERSVALYPPEFGEAPLSLAFREAWIEWRETWEGIAPRQKLAVGMIGKTRQLGRQARLHGLESSGMLFLAGEIVEANTFRWRPPC